MMGPYENGGSNLLVHNHFIQPTILVYTQLLDNTHIYQVPGCQSYPPLWAPLNHRFWSVNPHDSSGIYHQMPNFIPYLIRVVYPSWLAGQSLIEFDDCPARNLLGFPAGKLGSIPLSPHYTDHITTFDGSFSWNIPIISLVSSPSPIISPSDRHDIAMNISISKVGCVITAGGLASKSICQAGHCHQCGPALSTGFLGPGFALDVEITWRFLKWG